MVRVLLFALLLLLSKVSASQTPGLDKSVMLSATLSVDPYGIVISWQPFADATSFAVYRKSKEAASWGNPLINGLPGNTTSFTDFEVLPGNGYEYRVLKSGGTVANGYIYAGFDLPAEEFRGSLALVIDTLSTQGLEEEIARWVKDAEGDGWRVHPIRINQIDAVTDVKARIQELWYAEPDVLKAVFLLGRVPVPYSGEIAPDGHVPDHLGAWPADSYYGEMNGNWTDGFVNNAGASDERNRNIPGDGKFDQSVIPSDLELMVGRVDMRNLPQFGLSETELIRRYLDKNHAYRNRQFEVQKKAIIDDNFTGYAEGFSATGWRSFSALCGADQVSAGDYLGSLSQESHQWSYGCGAGSYNSCSGVATSGDFAGDSLLSVFTVLFGSYFGDWDSPANNFLRVPLASGTTLANCWGGRPFWYFHHMAMGDPIGFAARVSMNNSATYDFNNSQRGVHMALMGDPTLRADVVSPPGSLVADYANGVGMLSWSESPEATEGYLIYRKGPYDADFTRISGEPVLTGHYTDSCFSDEGLFTYMVRALHLEVTNAGTYYNLSTGICDTLFNPELPFALVPGFTYEQGNLLVSFQNTSLGNDLEYEWDFGDGSTSTEVNPSHQYSEPGTYSVTLAAWNGCLEDSVSVEIEITLSHEEVSRREWSIYPNPTSGMLTLNAPPALGPVLVFDAMGRLVAQFSALFIDMGFLHQGTYTIYYAGSNFKVIII